MIAMRDLAIPHEKINVHGVATALGHPIGASGARVLATLFSAIETHAGRKGVSRFCASAGVGGSRLIKYCPQQGRTEHG